MQRQPGTYLLLITLPHTTTCPIGPRKRIITFPKGSYVYIGSACNGLDQRIQRHLRTTKKHHWHIDDLLTYATTIQPYTTTDPSWTECRLATTFQQQHTPIPNFGNSDCTCPTHLYHGTPTRLNNTITTLPLSKYPIAKP